MLGVMNFDRFCFFCGVPCKDAKFSLTVFRNMASPTKFGSHQ